MLVPFWTTAGLTNLGVSIRLSVCYVWFFSRITALRNFSNFIYGYGALWEKWRDRALVKGKIQIWPIMVKNGQKQPTITFFKTLTKNSSKDFSDFWCVVSRDDSLSFYTNHMSRKIIVLKLWPKKLSANQITHLLFQTLTKNDFKEFLNFYMMIVEMILYHHV